MDIINKIEYLPIDKKIRLIDYMEGMPSTVTGYIKLNFNKPFMNPSLFNGTQRIMSPYSTVIKYINKTDVKLTENPMASYYQAEYCSVMYKINKMQRSLPRNMISNLINLMHMECYDYESLIKVERAIGDILEYKIDKVDKLNYEIMKQFIDMISCEIMHYKLQVYDLYSQLNCMEDINFGESYMSNLNNSITYAIRNGSGYSGIFDTAILIYVYINELGISKDIHKYPILNRFKYSIVHRYNIDTDCGDSENYANSVMEKIEEFVNSDEKISDLLSRLSHPESYNTNFSMKDDECKVSDGNNNISSNGYIFFLNNIVDLYGNENIIATGLNTLTVDLISDYLPFDVHSKDNILYSLSDNEYGHLINTEGMSSFGTAFRNSDSDMKYIGKYKDNFYLFFKIREKPNTIYGISVSDVTSGVRALFCVNMSKDYFYKYTSSI